MNQINKKIAIIINPAAGGDVPILSLLNRALEKSKIQWDIYVTTKAADIKQYISDAIENNVTAIAVYGGDGTITEAASNLYRKNIPLIILPGGTANIMAKELKIPDLETAIAMLTQETYTIKKVDIGLCNNTPFLLRVSTGMLAEMVTEANTQAKLTFGQLAYTANIAQKLTSSTPSSFSITIDDQELEERGISLVIANSGNIGFSGISILPDVNIDDGFLDVFLIKSADIAYLTTIAKESFIDKTDTTIGHWKGKEITIKSVKPQQQVIADDVIIDAMSIKVSVIASTLSVVVPTI